MKNLFYKYDCNGNSFIIVKFQDDIDYSKFSRQICSKDIGVGADGLIIVKDKINEILFYNQDGTKASFCGNATRAYINFIDEHTQINNRVVSFIFNDKIYTSKIISKDPFIVKTILNKQDNINLLIKSKFNSFQEKITLPNVVNFKNCNIELYPIKIGVFHIVIINKNQIKNKDFLSETDLKELKIILKEYYLEEPNITIYNVNTNEFTFYERGVGYTRTCGSGSVAVGIILELMNLLNQEYLKIEDDLTVVVKKDEVELIGKSKLICWGKYLC